MKKISLLVAILFCSNIIFCLGQSPEKWKFTKAQNNSGEYELTFTVTLEPDWHIYSQFTDEGGPLPMVFKFNESTCFERIGTVTEPEPHVEFDSLFMVNLRTFDKEVSFKQKVKMKSQNCSINGTVEYQICKEACIFKETAFSFEIGNAAKK